MAAAAKAIILAGGLGTRLRPLTDSLPKCLVPIAGRPLLDYWVDRLVEAGVEEARVNNHAHAGLVREHLAKVRAEGRLKLTESFEPVLLGSAGTITANADLADDTDAVIVVYADNFSDVDLKQMLAFHRSHGDPFTMLLFRAPNPSACGIAELDLEGRIISFVEKPTDPKSDLANGGVYIVDADAYREIAAMHAFDLGFEVLPQFVGRMRGWPWEGYHLDVGTLEALDKARRDAPTLRTAPKGRPAVFLDRDGTVIEHVHYIADPDKVRLVADAGPALRRLQDAGLPLVVVTNQSAIGRGAISVEQYEQVSEEMNRQLLDEGITLAGIYHCPEVPTGDDRTTVTHGDRKPGPGMLLRASADLGLDPAASWMIGDMVSDALAGINAGCRESFLLGPDGTTSDSKTYRVVPDLTAAADLILGSPAARAATPHPESRH